MAHIDSTYGRLPTASHGGGGAQQSSGVMFLALAAVVGAAGLLLPAGGLVALSSVLLLAGFGLAVVVWLRPVDPSLDDARGRYDVAALIVFLGFLTALLGDTEALLR